MNFKDIFSKKQPVNATPSKPQTNANDITIKLFQEFTDRSRKDIRKWRDAIQAAENPENPRWYLLQDLLCDLVLDAHAASVMDIRKAATMNHRFYVTDLKGEVLQEQTDFLNKSWFFEFLDTALDANYYKYSVMQFFRNGDNPVLSIIPRRNCCPTFGRVYLEVGGEQFIDYRNEPGVIEIMHNSAFGLLNDVVPNVIWKRNALQSYAEFSEKFGMPLITATTQNKTEVSRIEKMLKQLGEAAQAVLPHGTTVEIHDMANAGNPEKCYLSQARFQDEQVSKRFVGSTTMADTGANRSQTEVHERTLDDKIAASDKRSVMFVVNDKLMPLLQSMGFKFDNTKMKFQFDETEELNLTEHWKIVKEAMLVYEIDDKWVAKTFNIPITGRKAAVGATLSPDPNPKKPNANFNAATSMRAMAVAYGINLPEYSVVQTLHATSLPKNATANKSLLDALSSYDQQIASFLYNDNITDAERQRLLKGKRVAEDLREGLFSGWGKRRLETNWNAPDHRSLAMMEMNLFHFSESKGRAEVLLLNRLLIDKETNQIRSEHDFIEQAKQINAQFNQTYLATERDFAIATGQNSARYLEFFAEKDTINTWEYQTVGDDHVRDEHQILDGRVFYFNDVDARRLWPPNGYKCRCEGIQHLGKPGDKLMSGNDAIQVAFPSAKQREMFAINRADSGVVFQQNQMYMATLTDSSSKTSVGKAINDYTFNDYGLKNWKDMSGLKPLKLDNTITPANVAELFTNNAETKDFKAMGFDDYLKRKLIMKESTFTKHTKGKYVIGDEQRHQLFAHLSDIMANPSEVYMRINPKTKAEQLRYIRFYSDKSIIIDTNITSDGLEIQTWYENKLDDSIRGGLWIK
jgi:SPP1 gp7 family putative phage head morphogenesis protein